MTKTDIQLTIDLLSSPKKISIIPHRNPDGDAMGSCLGLYHFLKTYSHHHINIVSPNQFPDFLAWMPESENILIYEEATTKCTEVLQNSDLIFTLDFNALHRVGSLESVLQTLDTTFIMIDHHEKPDDYATITYSNPLMSSTCEMIYHFINYLGETNRVNQTIATCLYTGLITDTGSFKYACTTSETLRIAALLKDTGIDTSSLYNQLFDNNTPNRLQILGKALQNLCILSEHQTAYISLSQEELNTLNYKKGDTEGIVNYGLSIKGIIFAAFFTENKEEGIIKISFRSIGDFDVNQFARDYFEGGGHKNAAGGKSTSSLQDTINKFVTIVSNT